MRVKIKEKVIIIMKIKEIKEIIKGVINNEKMRIMIMKE